MEYPRYPFTAVVGQEQAKKALLLALVNPRTGGLLISGKRGTAKSVLVRATAPFTPTGSLVELPLGATDDMVFGGLDVMRCCGTASVVCAMVSCIARRIRSFTWTR